MFIPVIYKLLCWFQPFPSLTAVLVKSSVQKKVNNALEWPIETTGQAKCKERNRHMEDDQNETERQSVRARDRENVGPENLNLIQFFNLKMS